DEYSYAERMAADQLRSRYHVASLPLLPVAQYSEGEGCGQSVGEYVHWRVPRQHTDERLLRVFDFADHAGKLLVASVIPHRKRESLSEHATWRLTGRNERQDRVVVQFEEGNNA